jgi:hypothetical protein
MRQDPPSVGYPAHAYNHQARNIQPMQREPWWQKLKEICRG